MGDPKKEKQAVAESARKRAMRVEWWEDIWEVAEKATMAKADLPGTPNPFSVREVVLMDIDGHIYDVHSYFYSSTSPDSPPAVVKVTHLVSLFTDMSVPAKVP